MVDKQRTNKWLIFIAISAIVLFCFSYKVGALLASQQENLTASVFVYDPNNISILISAIPEKRIPAILDRILNRSTNLTIKFYNHSADRIPANVVTSSVLTSDDDGTKFWLVPTTTVAEGSYDITVKGYSHLTRLLSDTSIISTVNVLDFTDNGTNPLKCGDVNGTSGDDEINALDVSLVVNNWSGANPRYDLNRDEEVNSIDISNLLANFNDVGD